MNIREPRQFDRVRAQRQARFRLKKAKRTVLAAVITGVIVAIIGYVAYARPLPALAAHITSPVVNTETVALDWPSTGQAAVGVEGQGILAATPNQRPVPMASVAKVMTALAILKKYPLTVGQTGPAVPITADDVALYTKYIAIDGSVTAVQVGEQISEYQILQAILLPSANNVADTAAIWAYGSMAHYHTAANQLAQSLGMTQTTITGDASGFLPETISTPGDLVLLGQAALANPVIKQIVAQATADLPIVGTVSNVNFLLGENGNIGIKTGNSDQAGGCYLFAVQRPIIGGKNVTLIGAVMTSPSLLQAAKASIPLSDSFFRGFGAVTVIPKGTVVAHYNLPWGGQAVAVTTKDAIVTNWRGSKPKVTFTTAKLKAPVADRSPVGVVTLQTAYDKTTTPLVISGPVPVPGWWWRIRRTGF